MIKKMPAFLLLLLLFFSAWVEPAQAQQPDPPTTAVSALENFARRWSVSDHPQPTAAPLPPTPQADKVVYLTFDDGPDPRWTPEIVKLLKAYQAQATFFVLGRSVVSNPTVIKQAAEAGQFFGNHSFNHTALGYVGFSTFSAEVNDTAYYLKAAVEDEPELLSQITPCLRPPYGETSPSLYQNASALGMWVTLWTIDTEDWKNPDPSEVIQAVVEKVKPGDVILMHDGGEKRENTIKSLALVLHELSQRGYGFAPMCTSAGLADALR
ncbi:MAG: polysaccharide deacetylase family protein [Chloroflexi bacterium]|nr:polysaccharide deacetylase family protein [Chloroflexota bacterium]